MARNIKGIRTATNPAMDKAYSYAHSRNYSFKGGNKYKKGKGVGRIKQKDIFSIKHGDHKEKRGTRTGEITE